METKGHPIAAGIGFILAAPLSAFCGAAAFGLFFSLSFNALFYSIWGVLTLIGVLSIIGGIQVAIDRRKEIKS